MHWNFKPCQKLDLWNCWNSTGSQTDWGLDSPHEGQLGITACVGIYQVCPRECGAVRPDSVEEALGWRVSFGFPEGHDQKVSNLFLYMSQRCTSQSSRTTWYPRVARGTFWLLRHAVRLAHEETEQSGQAESSDDELKWSTSHEQPFINQRIYRMSGGLSVLLKVGAFALSLSLSEQGWDLTFY